MLGAGNARKRVPVAQNGRKCVLSAEKRVVGLRNAVEMARSTRGLRLRRNTQFGHNDTTQRAAENLRFDELAHKVEKLAKTACKRPSHTLITKWKGQRGPEQEAGSRDVAFGSLHLRYSLRNLSTRSRERVVTPPRSTVFDVLHFCNAAFHSFGSVRGRHRSSFDAAYERISESSRCFRVNRPVLSIYPVVY